MATRLAPEQRREQILDVARRLFSERHYAAVSTEEIAAGAGIRRGLLHHYFGTKRELYLEVVREMVRLPEPPADVATWAQAVDGWLTMVERNQGTWVTAIGPGGDPEVEPILEAARESAATRVLRIAGAPDTPVNRAAVRAYGAAAEEATLEWLVRNRLSRDQVHDLLTRALPALVGDQETP